MLTDWLADTHRVISSLPWEQIKSHVPHFLWFFTLVAVFSCLLKLGKIRDIIREFNNARGPIWDLRETVRQIDDLKGTVKQIEGLRPVIEKMQRQVGGLAPAIQQMDEQIVRLESVAAAARKQMAEWQIESVSDRTEGTAPNDQTSVQVAPGTTDENFEENWQKLREIWRRNTERIEYIIEGIRDGRTRQSIDQLPRTNYNRIINKLEAKGLLKPEAARASRELNGLFNAYRPRNSRVRSEVIGALLVLDTQLDLEIVPYSALQDPATGDDPAPADRVPNPPRMVGTPDAGLGLPPQRELGSQSPDGQGGKTASQSPGDRLH